MLDVVFNRREVECEDVVFNRREVEQEISRRIWSFDSGPVY